MIRVPCFRWLVLATLTLLAPAKDAESLAAVAQRAGGRLGVMAVATGTGQTLTYHADDRFPLCSTFKLLLAAQVLKQVDEGKASLDRIIPYGPADILAHAPVTAKPVPG